jgi:hypothetical protein
MSSRGFKKDGYSNDLQIFRITNQNVISRLTRHDETRLARLMIFKIIAIIRGLFTTKHQHKKTGTAPAELFCCERDA